MAQYTYIVEEYVDNEWVATGDSFTNIGDAWGHMLSVRRGENPGSFRLMKQGVVCGKLMSEEIEVLNEVWSW